MPIYTNVRKLEISFEEILEVSRKGKERALNSLWREVIAVNPESSWHVQGTVNLSMRQQYSWKVKL